MLAHFAAMPPIETKNAPPVVGLEGTAFFLDLDAIAAETIPDLPLDRIARLSAATGGAVALVSAQSVADVDAMVAPLRLPVIGLDGGERHDASGEMMRSPVDGRLLGIVVADLTRFSFANPGTLVEVKTTSVALHYTKRPDLEPLCLALAQDLATEDPRIAVMSRKGEIELMLAALTTGDAVQALMATKPFAGRMPVVIGASETFEPAFATANHLGGISIKLGLEDSETIARHGLEDVVALKSYLATLLAKTPLPAL
jgi:trehalose 6-phosphate phosphatase